MLMGQKSITSRLTLLFSSVSTLILLLSGLIIGTLAERHFEELDVALLDGKLELIQHALKNVRSNQELEGLPAKLNDSLVGHPGLAIVISGQDGRRLYSSGDAEFPQELLSVTDRKNSTSRNWTNSTGHRFRGVSAESWTSIKDAPPVSVAVATDTARHEDFVRSFRIALWSIVGLAALLTGFLAWIVARRGLAPLQKMRQSAADITANRLDQRLSVTSIPVELAEVAETLNAMLARLQGSFRRLSDFSSDLAHELRTPVSNLLTQTQVMLSKTRTPEQYRDVLASNVEEFERLSRMIGDMLFLAKSDNELIIPFREQVDLHKEVAKLFEFYEALAEEKEIRLTLNGSAFVSGDRLMLRRAINNLLSNAFRHTPPGGQIVVRIDKSNDSAVTLSVENTGYTIPAEHLPRLFDRFYRVDASRQRIDDGTGLGLAITRSILRAHGGDTFARSVNGVATFELRIPA